MKKIDEILSSLSLEEKCRLVMGYKTMATFPIPEKGVRSLTMSDGPNGLRKEKEDGDSLGGISKTIPSTCFPTGVGLASTFDESLLAKVGEAIGEECLDHGVNVLLGPAINIQRNPLCGRNFEYYSEDPILAGKLGASFVKGVQSQGVGACLKHFACNNNEKYRFVGDSILDERALHEIYLRPFEIAVKEAKPFAIMTAYNRVNGSFCSENDLLLNQILRKEWGFDGLAMTDWGGIKDKVEAIAHGLSLEMPGMEEHNVKVLFDAVKEERLPIEKLDAAAKDILLALQRTEKAKKGKCDYQAHYDLAVLAAIEGAVLLENRGVLPLKKENHFTVIGDLFQTMRYQGSGSSLLNPYSLKTHKEYFEERRLSYSFARGYDESSLLPNKKLEEEALSLAKSNDDVILFYGGQNDYVESEGFDRESMTIPENQLSLLSSLLSLGKTVVFVLFGGSPVELPFAGKVAALLNMNLAGEGEGEATTKILFGEATPNGRLSQCWMKRYLDVPFAKEFVQTPNEQYKESIFVGYRNHLTRGIALNYPFGYGLSYGTFAYGKASFARNENEIVVSLDVKNEGAFPGAEVVQVYSAKEDSAIVRPLRELKGFAKVHLAPGETKAVAIAIPLEFLKVYSPEKGGFVLEGGEYQLEIAKNASEVVESLLFTLEGETLASSRYDEIYNGYLSSGKLAQSAFEEVIGHKVPEYVFFKKPYTLETPLGEMKSFVGKIFAKATANVGYKQYKRALKMPDGPDKEREKKAGLFVYKLMPNNSLRSLCFSASGNFPYKLACGILLLANGKFIQGIKALTKKEVYGYEE